MVKMPKLLKAVCGADKKPESMESYKKDIGREKNQSKIQVLNRKICHFSNKAQTQTTLREAKRMTKENPYQQSK